MDPDKLSAYSTGYQQRVNREAWLFGLYCYGALCCALQNAFRKKSDPISKYPAEPYDLFPKKETAQEMQLKEEQEALKARLYMHQLQWAGRNWGK